VLSAIQITVSRGPRTVVRCSTLNTAFLLSALSGVAIPFADPTRCSWKFSASWREVQIKYWPYITCFCSRYATTLAQILLRIIQSGISGMGLMYLTDNTARTTGWWQLHGGEFQYVRIRSLHFLTSLWPLTTIPCSMVHNKFYLGKAVSVLD